MTEKKESKIHPFVWPALGIFIALGLLLALMLTSDRQFGPGQAYLNQNTGGEVYDRDPGSGITRPVGVRGDARETRTQLDALGNDSSRSDSENGASESAIAGSGAEQDEAFGDSARLGFYERLSAGLGAAKGVEPTQDAAECEGHCDCPQGHVCRPDVGRCVETEHHPIYCCVQDGCPAGEACVEANGSEGTCGAAE